MQLYTENEGYRLFMGDMNDMEAVIESESIDSIVTDPPKDRPCYSFTNLMILS